MALRDPEIEIQRASEVVAAIVDWAWTGRIPMGNLSRLDGDPGLGKSTIALDLGARFTTGRPMPGENGRRDPGDLLVVAAEDDAATIRMRLEAAGADLTRVHIVTDDVLMLPQHTGWLETTIIDRGIEFVIIDPLMSFLSAGINAHHDQDVRKALRPLKGIAERTGAAMLLVGHLNKGAGKAIHRSIGSIGLLASVRVALMAIAQDTSRCYLVPVKSNLGPLPEAWVFEIVDDGHGRPAVDWIQEVTIFG